MEHKFYILSAAVRILSDRSMRASFSCIASESENRPRRHYRKVRLSQSIIDVEEGIVREKEKVAPVM